MTKPQRFALAVVSRLPKVLVSDTERIGLSLAFICIGIGTLLNLGRPSTLGVTEAMAINWSVTLILGGLLTIWGMVKSHRLTERVGVALAGYGCAIYGATVLSLGQTRSAIIVGVMFLCLAVIKLIRLLTSTAAQALIAERHAQEDA